MFPICVDGRMLGQPATGVATYAHNLVAALRGVGRAPLILGDGGERLRRTRAMKWLAAARPGVRALAPWGQEPCARDIFREAQVHFDLYGRLLTLALPGPPGVMHWTYPLPMRIAGWRNLYTVHDAIPLDPGIASPIDPRRHRRLLDRIVEDATRIVTVSESARADIVARLGCTPDFVVNCSQAVDVPPVPEGALPAGLERGAYFVFIGSIETRKNLSRLIAAYRRADLSSPLVLVGPDGQGAAGILREAAGHPAIVRLPFQPRDALLRILAGAKALLFPSLAEGFGLPVIEAMMLGVPVLTSAGGALEEVAGGAALLVDPMDVGTMASSIASLERDASLRARLSAAGRDRARAFAPGPYAERLLNLYREIL